MNAGELVLGTFGVCGGFLGAILAVGFVRSWIGRLFKSARA